MKSTSLHLLKYIVLTGISLFCYCSSVTHAVAPFFISESDERRLGDKFKAEILANTKEYPRFTNTIVNNYIDSLGQLMSTSQRDRDSLRGRFTFTVIHNDTVINAFAIPGGHVFIYTGLLKNAKNQAEVVGVLAHEIGHITKYHSRDLLVQSSAVGLVNDILFGSDSSVTKAVANMVASLVFLKFSRDHEFQADSCAVAYSEMINNNSYGMKSFLAFLRDKYGEQPKIFEPMSTHPNISDRINKIEKLSPSPTDSLTRLYKENYDRIKKLLN